MYFEDAKAIEKSTHQKPARAAVSFESPGEALAVLGTGDEFFRLFRESFSCQILSRGDGVNIVGEADEVEAAEFALREIIALHRRGIPVTAGEIRRGIKLAREKKSIAEVFGEAVGENSRGEKIYPKTPGQREYVRAIRKNAVTLGIGPAGTGKTYLATVMAATYLRRRSVRKIILTRPVVEAGEHLGFLPGDIEEKVNPYLRPIYDALSDIFGFETYQKLIQKGLIEIAPLAYMRGRTLENSFVILDEAQNTTRRQMKMFLTRLGQGSKMVANGDLSQIDLTRGTESGLMEAAKVLHDVKGVGVSRFSADEIIRHDVVTRIVEAYEKYEAAEK